MILGGGFQEPDLFKLVADKFSLTVFCFVWMLEIAIIAVKITPVPVAIAPVICQGINARTASDMEIRTAIMPVIITAIKPIFWFIPRLPTVSFGLYARKLYFMFFMSSSDAERWE